MATVREILGRVARRELTAAEAAPLLRALAREGRRAPAPTVPAGAEPEDDLVALRRMTAAALKLPAVDPDRPLSDYGLTSITVTALLQAVNAEFGTGFAPTVIFEFTTLRAFAAHLRSVAGRRPRPAPTESPVRNVLSVPAVPPVSASSSVPVSSPGHSAPPACAVPPVSAAAPDAVRSRAAAEEIEVEMARLWAEAEAALARGALPVPAQPVQASRIRISAAAPATRPVRNGSAPARIAIVGMAGILPQCDDLDAFWAALAAGRDLVTEAPRERWDWREFAKAPAPGARWGGFVRDPAAFDASFFGVSPLEAKLMDPQQRLFLETVWRTLEHAGYRPADLAGSDLGVFVGVSTSDYFEAMRAAGSAIDAHTSTGFAHAMLANRASFLFDWRGPSQVIDTACSSSLVALHRAAQAMAAGDCRMALVGGVNLLLTPTMFLSFSQAGMLSPDGRCQAFDARANGFVRGEGVGAVLLKPLEAAEADGDTIHAVILATAENHGGRAASLTAPNPAVQADLLVEAYRRAAIDPRSVGYIETHGTGTALGDPIEFTGLARAFARMEAGTPAKPEAAVARCWLGSVKTNIGHLESAAGIAGLLKTVLALRHGTVPPNLHFQTPNPHLDFAGTRFAVPTRSEPWPRCDADGGGPRRAGVSSFGFGGAYAHVVVEEGPRVLESGGPDEGSAPEHVLLSASDSPGLDGLIDRWLSRLGEWRSAPERAPRLADVAATSRAGRIAERCRLAVRVQSLVELEAVLRAARRGAQDGRILRGEAAGDGPASGFIGEHGAWPETGEGSELARHWCAGGAVAWSMRGRRRVPIPGRTFERRRHWFDAPAAPESNVRPPSAAAPPPWTMAHEPAGRELSLPRTSAAALLPGGVADAAVPLFNLLPASASAPPPRTMAHEPAGRELSLPRTSAAAPILERVADAPPSAAAPLSGMLAYEPVWVDEPVSARATAAGVAIFGSAATIAAFRRAAAAWASPSVRLRWVICGEAPREANGTERTIDSSSADGLADAIRRLREEGFDRLVLLSESLLPAFREGTGGRLLFKERVVAAVALGWRLIQAASREGSAGDPPPRLTIAFHASGGVDAAREEALAAALASAFQEKPGLIGHAVGFQDAVLDPEAILRAVAAEAAADAEQPREVRYRHGARAVRALRERAPDAGPGLPLRSGGTYLAAGALGEVGLRLAGWLARDWSATVIVLGRRRAGPETAAAIAQLDVGPGRVLYRCADVTDREQLRAAVGETVAAHGPVHGVFHLARTVESSPLPAKDEAAFVRVTAAKVEGAVQLDAATVDEPLDFFAMFSSIAADWGVAGAADYAYACRFQNAFAAVRRTWTEGGLRRGGAIAIGWPQWRHDAHSNAGRDRFLQDRGFALLDEAAGFTWLARTLDPRRPHSAFVCGDAARLRPMLEPASRRALMLAVTAAAPADDRTTADEQAVRDLLAELSDAEIEALFVQEIAEQPSLAVAPVAPDEAPDRGRAPDADELQRTIRAVLGAVLQLEPDRMKGASPFDRLGMDSILGVRVVQRLEAALGITLPPRWLVENPTIDSLAQKIRASWRAGSPVLAPKGPRP